MSINQLYAEANTFDIMLFRSSSIAAKTIRLYTQSEWDHVGIVVRKNQFEEKNWRLLEAKRHVIEDSHEFLLESVGVYENMHLMDLGCGILIEKYKTFIENVKTNNKIIIEPNRDSTVPNEFMIKLLDEDYTLANPLVYYMYQKHYIDDKSITFVGFRKPHPHNNVGEIRLAFAEPTDASTAALYLTQAATKCAELYKNVQNNFSKS